VKAANFIDKLSLLYYMVLHSVMKKIVKPALPQSAKEALNEANRYFKNAKEVLNKSSIEYNIYTDSKNVKEASAMGYLAALRALDSYLLVKNTKAEELPASIEEYIKSLRIIPLMVN